ncbi:hypothetical protein MYAM1_002119 [Malassezia yamatoensis]|uniref:BAG domain-containing protein n=1 Tax=Malassezia yamatoensis TaxID=253288 RepID=A0AAJ5YSI4_9BASI|nr:hypothetical protein MYAM1_002119 [Malassezia yamatoensis]
MSWFSNQWNRWNQGTEQNDFEVKWVEVVYERQLYQVRLGSVQGGNCLRDLRHELAQVFSLPVPSVKVLFSGKVLKDDRVSLSEYGIHTGSRIVLAVNDPDHKRRPTQANEASQHVHPQNTQQAEQAYYMQKAQQAQQAQQAKHAHYAPQGQVPQGYAPQGPGQGQHPLQNMPPGTSAVNQSAGGPQRQTQAASHRPDSSENGTGTQANASVPAAAPAEPPLSEDEQHLQQIAKVQNAVRDTLLPEVVQFEQTIASLPDAAKGAQTVANEENQLVPTKRIPITQRKISEYLLRELMKLDGVPVDTDQIRTARKSTVKEIQSYLDRLDAAWKVAMENKGVVNDI